MVQSPSPPRLADALAAEAWAEVTDLLDLQLSPLGLRAMGALSPRRGEIIMDVGCGAGQTVLQLADAVGPSGRVIGVDIAALLLHVARRRASGRENVDLIEGDALRVDLADASVDAVFSRFGVMAFADPVATFSNLHRMLRPAGRLAFVCWRSLEENELDLLPLRAAGLEHRADLTPFSFERPAFIEDVLDRAGFREIGITADDQAVSSGDLDAMTTVLLKVGPLGRIVRENPDLKALAEPRVRTALAASGDPSRVVLQAATWVVKARA